MDIRPFAEETGNQITTDKEYHEIHKDQEKEGDLKIPVRENEKDLKIIEPNF